MKVIIRRQADYELILDEDGITPDGQYFDVIPDVLADKTADREEKTRTIVAVNDFTRLPVRDEYSVFVLDDSGNVIFTGSL